MCVYTRNYLQTHPFIDVLVTCVAGIPKHHGDLNGRNHITRQKYNTNLVNINHVSFYIELYFKQTLFILIIGMLKNIK